MPFSVIEWVTEAGGPVNEDRAGASGALAWIIDGATDVVARPLTRGPSDAAWLAETLHVALTARGGAAEPDLRRLVHDLTAEAARAFSQATRRHPSGREEHPSAAGIVLSVDRDRLAYVALGDCALIARAADGTLTTHGVGAAEAGDATLAATIAAFNRGQAAPSAAAARRHIWPQVRARRAGINTPEGYGVFSITPPPVQFVVCGSIELPAACQVLLLTDGLARLVDVFRRYSPAGLLEAAGSRGLRALVAELRMIEEGDPECVAFPRAKPLDDATGLLLAVE